MKLTITVESSGTVMTHTQLHVEDYVTHTEFKSSREPTRLQGDVSTLIIRGSGGVESYTLDVKYDKLFLATNARIESPNITPNDANPTLIIAALDPIVDVGH